jgi:hypothetical protein
MLSGKNIMDDYSEITASFQRRITVLDNALERKQWASAQIQIGLLRIDFTLLDEFVEKKLGSGKIK